MTTVKNADELIKLAESKDKSEYGMNQIKQGFTCTYEDVLDKRAIEGKRLLRRVLEAFNR